MPRSSAPLREGARADVLVVGGGPAGVAAALAAAGQGASVLLVERYGFLGGMGAQGLEALCGFFIPLRCLLPAADAGLIVAGRCLSADLDAQASARVMGTCLAMGQAAGVAAAMAVEGRTSPAAISVGGLRDRLRALRAVLE